MTIVKKYDVGDDVVIEPYDIFTEPQIPIGWNTSPYRYGTEYYPGQTFKYEKPLTLFAQYQEISVSYHIVLDKRDGNYEVYHPGFMARLGQFIEIADFFIDGFKEWQLKSGETLSIGQRYQLTGNIDLYMSADMTYALYYDANSGSGNMDPSYATQHVYFDKNNNQPIIQNAIVTLNDCLYTKYNYQFKRWKILNNYYDAGNILTMHSDLTAYAEWEKIFFGKMNYGMFLVNSSISFRYIMLKIDSVYGDSKKISISQLSFNDDSKNIFKFPEESFIYGKNISIVDSSYGLINMLFKNNSLFEIDKFPCYIVIDLKTSCFDSSKYNFWKLCITSEFSNCIMSLDNFSLYLSNDKISWYLASQYSNTLSSNNKYNSTYNGQLCVDEYASDLYL